MRPTSKPGQTWPTWSPRLLPWLNLLFLLPVASAALTTLPASATDDSVPQFREPGSGHRVSGYTIDLDAGDGDVLTYKIPDDCERLITGIGAEPRHLPTPMVRQAWRKVETDCRYYLLLHSDSQLPHKDYVSSFDFMNMSLDQLPVTVLEDRDDAMSRRPPPDRRTGIVENLPMALPDDPSQSKPATACRLLDGLLRGDVFIDDNGQLRCSAGDGRPTLRLITVDFSDVNGDQVTDAILRFVFLRPGMPRGPMILPMTRDAPDGALRPVTFQAPDTGADKE